eukprot:1835153-Rhodomonas_salina.2
MNHKDRCPETGKSLKWLFFSESSVGTFCRSELVGKFRTLLGNHAASIYLIRMEMPQRILTAGSTNIGEFAWEREGEDVTARGVRDDCRCRTCVLAVPLYAPNDVCKFATQGANTT